MAENVERVPEDKIVNGVNVTALMETIRSVRERPELANFKFRASNRWMGGGYSWTQVKDFYGTCQMIERKDPMMMEFDEHPILQGDDRGANPVEYLLGALSACLTTTLAYHAAMEGIEIKDIESDYECDIDLHGFLDLDPTVRAGCQEIRVNLRVKTDVDEEKLAELVMKSPIFDVITNGTRVVLNVENR